MKNNNVQQILNTLEAQLVDHVVVAYSGGMDSHVLLHALATYFPSLSLEAVHVNHQQSKHADAWVLHTKSICETLKVPYHCCAINPVINSGDSVEAYLREARYAVLKKYIHSQNSALFLAHHADDQVETVFLRLLRGTGPTGLAAMSFSSGKLRRPFLSFSKEQLLTYAKEHQLNWIEDESNRNERFDRNYMRQKVVPVLKKRWPGLCKTILRTVDLCEEANTLLADMAKIDGVTTANPWDFQPLKPLSRERKRNAIRYWLLGLKQLVPSQAKLNDFLQQIDVAAADKIPTLYLQDKVIRYYRKKLYLGLKEPTGRLVVHEVKGAGLSSKKVSQPWTIARRSGGETIKIGNSHCHQQLKNCWQKWGVPPWLRDHYPLIYQDGDLIAVPNYAYDSKFTADPDEMGFLFDWILTD